MLQVDRNIRFHENRNGEPLIHNYLISVEEAHVSGRIVSWSNTRIFDETTNRNKWRREGGGRGEENGRWSNFDREIHMCVEGGGIEREGTLAKVKRALVGYR